MKWIRYQDTHITSLLDFLPLSHPTHLHNLLNSFQTQTHGCQRAEQMQRPLGRRGLGAPKKALGGSRGGEGMWVLPSEGEGRAGRALGLSGDLGSEAEWKQEHQGPLCWEESEWGWVEGEAGRPVRRGGLSCKWGLGMAWTNVERVHKT